MKCGDPRLCYTRGDGKRLFRHFSLATPVFKKLAQQVFNCDQCTSCRKRRARELAARCVLHASLYTNNCFLTLTYDESKDGYHNDFQYSDIQKFKKRLRQEVNTSEYCVISTRKIKRRRNPKWLYKKIEVFNVHEYGKNGKKHWHLIVFNHDFEDKKLHTMSSGLPLYTSDNLSRMWKYGFVTIGNVDAASAMYQAQYTQKDIKNGHLLNKKKAHSKHSGIGKPYFLKHYKQILTLGFVPVFGEKLGVPRYFEKLAHKHYCHFFEKEAFFDLLNRKKLYNKFKPGEANLEIALLYKEYKIRKEQENIKLKQEWLDLVSHHLTSYETPDFIKSEQNINYDLANKNNLKHF